MSKQQHTPGPWNINDSGFGVFYVNPKIEAGDETIEDPAHDSVVANTNGMGPWSGIPDEERKANARLIAAAPDMLAALRRADAWMAEHHNDGFPVGYTLVLRDVINAIAKAEGRES